MKITASKMYIAKIKITDLHPVLPGFFGSARTRKIVHPGQGTFMRFHSACIHASMGTTRATTDHK